MQYSITKQNITCVYDGKSYTVPETSMNYRLLRAALIAEDFELAASYLDVKKVIKNWKSSNGQFELVDGNIRFKGEPVQDVISTRIVELLKEEEDASALLNFYERLQLNPSARSVEQLYRFLEHCNIPLTPDGCFLAYKGVTFDYLDLHTRTIVNRPGTHHVMPRNKISDDPNHACHFGFHVGALDYAKSFGPQVVVCKVDPQHVVCVPYDSSNMKMRVCEYTVVSDFDAPLKNTVEYISEKEEEEKEEGAREWEEITKMNLRDLRKFAFRSLGIKGVYTCNKSEILDAIKHVY